MHRLLIPIFLLACRPPPIDGETDDLVQLNPPEIASLTTLCDWEKERWQIDVEATSWTGGGRWIWTLDNAYIEQHDVRSREAASDGSHDALRLTLDILADCRNTEKNKSTAFFCSTEPAFFFELYDPEGVVMDCRTGGPDPSRWETLVEASVPCVHLSNQGR